VINPKESNVSDTQKAQDPVVDQNTIDEMMKAAAEKKRRDEKRRQEQNRRVTKENRSR